MSKLILMRHGQSQWNLMNYFTGWVDIPLTVKGVEEAFEAGRKIKNEPIDLIYTSTLARAQMTAFLAITQHHSGKVPVLQHPEDSQLAAWGQIYNPEAQKLTIPVIPAWELNERMYGELQGLNKQETIDKYGAHQVQLWRRSYDVAPPAGESLEMTAARTIPYFIDHILPKIHEGLNVFVCAHGNSLRAIIMYLDKLSKDEVLHLELPTGEPVLYHYINDTFRKSS